MDRLGTVLLFPFSSSYGGVSLTEGQLWRPCWRFEDHLDPRVVVYTYLSRYPGYVTELLVDLALETRLLAGKGNFQGYLYGLLDSVLGKKVARVYQRHIYTSNSRSPTDLGSEDGTRERTQSTRDRLGQYFDLGISPPMSPTGELENSSNVHHISSRSPIFPARNPIAPLSSAVTPSPVLPHAHMQLHDCTEVHKHSVPGGNELTRK